MVFIRIILLVVIFLELLIFIYFIFNNKVNRYNKILLLSGIILLLLSVLVFVFNINIFKDIITNSDLILLIVSVFLVINLKLIYNYTEINKKYDNLLDCACEYEKVIDEQGKKNHEYNNQLMILKGYINDKKKLENYLYQIIDDHKVGCNYEIRQLAKVSNGGIKEMLYYKIGKIMKNKIKYFLYISSEASEYLENINIDIYDNITKVFGVIIDNAIDASLDSKEKEVGIDFSKDDNYITISISNTYNKKLDINKVGKKGYSSKGKGHGFGLRLVKEIIRKNNKLELITDHDDKYFVQTLLIDIK